MEETKQTQNQQSGSEGGEGFSSPLGGGDNQSQTQGFDWKSFAGNDPVLSQFQSPEELARAYLELQKKVGEDKISKPDLSNEEQLQQALKELGLPDSPDKYPDIEGIEDIFDSPEEYQEFKSLAHEIGLLPNQYAKFMTKLKEILQEDKILSEQERQEMTLQVVQELQKEWGNEFEPKMRHIQRVFKSLPQDLQMKIIEAGLDLDVDFIKFLDKVSQYFKEDTLTYSEFSVNDAKQELQRILNNPNHPYFNKEHPEHEEAVQKVQMLYRIIYGG